MHEREPTPEAIQVIRDHLAAVHGRGDFELRRDVSFVDNNPGSAVIVYLPESGLSAARFTCKDEGCAGLIFPAGKPTYGHPERNTWLLLAHRELGTTLLGGVTDPAERAMLLEDWDRGHLGQLEVKAARTRRSMRTKKAARPSIDERRARCQEYLLARVRSGASVLEAVDALDALRGDEPHAYERLMCGPDILKSETLRKYWSDIPIAVRNAARVEGDRARAARTGEKSTP
jgi:hypothetical protein